MMRTLHCMCVPLPGIVCKVDNEQVIMVSKHQHFVITYSRAQKCLHSTQQGRHRLHIAVHVTMVPLVGNIRAVDSGCRGARV